MSVNIWAWVLSLNVWIWLGAIAAAFAAIAIPYGFYLKSEESDERLISALRAAQNTVPNQIAIYTFNNNQFNFQGTQPKNDPGVPLTPGRAEAQVSLSLPSFQVRTSRNVTSITDSGRGQIGVVFANPFPNTNYSVTVTGNKTVLVKKISKARGIVEIQFEEEGLTEIEIVCVAN